MQLYTGAQLNFADLIFIFNLQTLGGEEVDRWNATKGHEQSFLSIMLYVVDICAAKRFKGTVRPDWICMGVVSLESPLKGHQPLYVFNFLFLILNI